MRTAVSLISVLSMPLLVTACASLDPGVKDYKMMQSVYKQQSVKDQQTLSDLRRELDAAQRDLKTAEATRAASEGKLSEALRRVEQQRDELTRAKDERTQAASQQTTQITPIIRQLTEELARAREDRAQFAQTMKLVTQHTVELERLKQTLAEAGQGPRLQSVETALNKQNEALAALQLSVQGVQESLAEAQRQAEKKPQRPATLPAGKQKQTVVPKDMPSAPKDNPSTTKDNPPAPNDSSPARKDSTPALKQNPPPPKDTLSATSTRKIIVKAGDTLQSLAEKHGVTRAQLKEMNQLATEDIQVGQSITVPSVNNQKNP